MPIEPLSIAVTIGPAGHGGTATYTRELTRALMARGDVALITVGSAAAYDQLTLDDGRTPSAHVDLPENRLAAQSRVAVLRRTIRDVDVFHGTQQVLPFRSPVPTVLTFHDDYTITRRSDYELVKRVTLPAIYRRTLRIADAMVTLAPTTIEVASRYARPGVPIVCAGAAVPSALRDAKPTAPARALPVRYALVVGDCSPRKQVDALLDAWTDRLDLVVAGGGLASLELLARLRSHGCHFVESPSWSELAHLYRGATVVVEPSADEGFGFTRIEAAHFGRPYVACREHPDLASAVALAEIEGNGHTGAPSAEPHDSWDAVADRTVAVYRSVIRERVN